MEKYQILKPIGKGSYGDVFLVRHLIDRKQYVLKKIFIKKSTKEKVLAQQEVCGNKNMLLFELFLKLIFRLNFFLNCIIPVCTVFSFYIYVYIYK